MSDSSILQDALAAELEWAETKLEEAHEEHQALQTEFETLKPDIREVATHPVAGEHEDEDPLDVLTDQYMQYRQKALDAERLRHQILQIHVQRNRIAKSVSGPSGALSFNLDFLEDRPELLDRAEHLTVQFERRRRTVWKVFYETLEQIDALVTDCRDEYIEEAVSVYEQIRELQVNEANRR